MTPILPGRSPDLSVDHFVFGNEVFPLNPGEFVLASTLEKVVLPANIAGRLEGKSSLGRLGLICHSTAGFIDPGFSGTLTLELSNLSPNDGTTHRSRWRSGDALCVEKITRAHVGEVF